MAPDEQVAVGLALDTYADLFDDDLDAVAAIALHAAAAPYMS